MSVGLVAWTMVIMTMIRNGMDIIAMNFDERARMKREAKDTVVLFTLTR